MQEANTIKQYRPVCLLNVDYEEFSKVLAERLTPVAKEVIGGESNWLYQAKKHSRRGGYLT